MDNEDLKNVVTTQSNKEEPEISILSVNSIKGNKNVVNVHTEKP